MSDSPAKPTLTAPFANTKEVQGMTYVPVAEVIDRLNACIGVGKWGCEVSAWRDERDPDFVIAKARLTAEGFQPVEQYGGQKINRKRDGEIIDLGNDMKGAISDATKKAAQMWGVALYIPLDRSPHGKWENGDAS